MWDKRRDAGSGAVPEIEKQIDTHGSNVMKIRQRNHNTKQQRELFTDIS